MFTYGLIVVWVDLGTRVCRRPVAVTRSVSRSSPVVFTNDLIVVRVDLGTRVRALHGSAGRIVYPFLFVISNN